MTKSELLEYLKNIPDTAVIYIEAEYGDRPETAGEVLINTQNKIPYYGDKLNWIVNTPNVENDKIIGVLIRY